MLHSIYCFPFFHSNRPFIVFSPLVLCFTPSLHRPASADSVFLLSSLFILRIHRLKRSVVYTMTHSVCLQTNLFFVSITKPIERPCDLPTHTIRKHTCVDADTHTWIFKQASHNVFTHTLMVCAVAETLSPVLLLPWRCNLGIATSSLSLPRLWSTQVLTVQVCFVMQCISDISCSFSANDTHSITLLCLLEPAQSGWSPQSHCKSPLYCISCFQTNICWSWTLCSAQLPTLTPL